MTESFFSQVPNKDLEDIGHTVYPDPVAFSTIDIEEIQIAILKFLSQSASGTDNIPNEILKTGLQLNTLCFHWLFNSSLNLRDCLRHFRDLITILLQKLKKSDYDIPKAYREIARMNTIGKTLDSIIANFLNWKVETFQLLLKGNMGGKKSTSPEHALHPLLESVKAA